ncbi:MAG: hypothetical protein EYC70_08960 [Planctomycetota bacterium]|nr:MAG: hypothetical protein EYC70_08960 [Planctomycetota bacterium]
MATTTSSLVLKAAILGTALLVPSLAPAQAPGGEWREVLTFTGTASDEGFAIRSDNAGDVDGDGLDDLIIGAPFADPAGMLDAGSAYVHSGADGSVLFQFNGVDMGDQFGSAVAGMGDLDGDGMSELAVGAPFADPFAQTESGAVYVFSGATGNLMWRAQGLSQSYLLGFSIANAGDVNGDGWNDVIAGAPYASPFNRFHAGSAFVYSGLDGIILRRIDGASAQDQLGYSVDGIGDADLDGLSDVIAGAPFADANFNNAGAVYVVNANTGALHFKVQGTDRNGELGWSVAGVGDLNMDGRGDFVAGIPFADQGTIGDAGRARVFSGFKGAVIYQWTGLFQGDKLGYTVDGPGDVNGDSFGDILVATPFAKVNGLSNAGRVELYSGFDNRLLQSWGGTQTNDFLGLAVDSAGDLDGDGFMEVAIGSSEVDVSGNPDIGQVWVYAYNPFLYPTDYAVSSSAGGSVTYNLDFPASEAGFQYQLLGSHAGYGPSTLGTLTIPLTQDGVFNLILSQSYPPGLVSGGTGTLDPNGDGAITIRIPVGGLSRYIASYFYFAVASLDTTTTTYRLSSGGMPLRIRM